VLEAGRTATILRHLKAIPFSQVRKTMGTARRRGEPDIFFLARPGETRRAVCFFFEVKRDGENATPLQSHVLGQYRAAGAVAEVVRSWADVKAILDKEGVVNT